ncbi:histone deacetylase family protein [Mesorhizobium sp. NZP2298]|uniref:histone deacetylase family protein n=1 Tax=Mesorhizobium sp. NZP2298 TaxID=2483403 RepID=UPI00155767D9|nr:histone deacetylase family protein [Mesorhizobium sp. NZP2298]QKC94834.1 histone deacetylase family protein [Mesorhizobium sp. NZP2298]
MKTVYSPLHALQDAEAEFIRGKRVPSFEMPRRAELVLAQVKHVFGDETIEPRDFGTEPLVKVHDEALVAFLSTFWDRWSAENGPVDAFPNAWPPPRSHRLRTQRIGAELGRFCIDMSSPIMEGTWRAVSASANVALTAQALVAGGERAAFALCRPPGHHAGRDYFGGYCFINNAAVAAQAFRDQGAARVAVLDVDYHHGNGTQDIFYGRNDILTVSIHADPILEYPYYTGYADEAGEGDGHGFNLNLPLPWGTRFDAYGEALDVSLSRIASFGAEALVISLGVDTFDGDPISKFKLRNADFSTIGRAIARLGLPTVFIMEGGYAVADIGINVVNTLSGFEDGFAK